MGHGKRLLNDPSVPPRPQFSIFGLIGLTFWVAVMLTMPGWWWRFLCIVQVVSFVLFVEFVVMNFPSGIQEAIRRNTVRLDGTISEKRVAIENAGIRNFKIQFLFQAGCVMVVVNLVGLIFWLSDSMWNRLQTSFKEQSGHPDAGNGIVFQSEFRLLVLIFIWLFLLFVVGGAIYFQLLKKLRSGVEGRCASYRQYDIEMLDRASRRESK